MKQPKVHKEKAGKATCCARLYLGVRQDCDFHMFEIFSFTLFLRCEKWASKSPSRWVILHHKVLINYGLPNHITSSFKQCLLWVWILHISRQVQLSLSLGHNSRLLWLLYYQSIVEDIKTGMLWTGFLGELSCLKALKVSYWETCSNELRI